jgi:DnaJ-class molecular chaperone
MTINPYSVLGVEPDADPAALKKAYRQAAKACHPDFHGSAPEHAEKFSGINHAYRLLSDSVRRRFYDTFGSDGVALGFDEATMLQSLRSRSTGIPRPEKTRVSRTECVICEGSGVRPSGRTCNDCDPNLSAGQTLQPQDSWSLDTNATSNRVRMPRKTPPPATRTPVASTEGKTLFGERTTGQRMRLRPKKRG